MEEEKINRKVKYTKMVLKESLIKLLKQKPISRITITEICAEADINRATFYAHYSDQFDLLREIEQELVEDIKKYIANYALVENDLQSVQLMEQIFEYIRENSEVCAIFLNEDGDHKFLKDILMIIQQQFIEDWTRKKVQKDIAVYIYAYATNGSVGVIQKWLRDGMVRSTREMAEIIIKLSDQGLSAFV